MVIGWPIKRRKKNESHTRIDTSNLDCRQNSNYPLNVMHNRVETQRFKNQ